MYDRLRGILGEQAIDYQVSQLFLDSNVVFDQFGSREIKPIASTIGQYNLLVQEGSFSSKKTRIQGYVKVLYLEIPYKSKS